MRIISAVFLFSLLLSACQTTTPTLKANVQSFANLAELRSLQRIYIIGYPEELDQSLEFQSYKPKITAHLSQEGFQVVDDAENSDLIAFVNFSIDHGVQETRTVSKPEWGMVDTGSKTTYGDANVIGNTLFYSETTTNDKRFGITGYRNEQVSMTMYTRNLNMDIYKTAELRNDKQVKVFEGRITSRGMCGNMPLVIDELLNAFFTKFPSGSGDVSVPWNGSC